MLYRIYLHMINQANYNRLKLDEFVVGDTVIIKIKQFPAGKEYYGILYAFDVKDVKIIGKPLSWVLNGDLKLDQYTFYTSSIESIQPYTREVAIEARQANELLRTERLNLLFQNPPFQT